MLKYDCIVIGSGVFGAWTAYWLRRSGRSVALLDALGPANSRSSSGGESRITRSSYGADEIYARWALASLDDWKQLFAEAGQPGLFQPTGLLWTAPEGNETAAKNRSALTKIGVPHECLTHAEIERRFPQIRFSWPVTGIYEPHSGVLLARRAVQVLVQQAVILGVDFRYAVGEPPSGRGRVESIRTGPGETIQGGEFIYACGPWLPKVFPALLRGRIRPTRQEVFFFSPAPNDRRFAAPALPAWLDFSDPRGAYSIPDIEARGFKLAFDQHGPEIDPDTIDRYVSADSVAAARSFVAERFPALATAPVTETRVCQYENTSTGDFLIDRHPGFENVWIAGGGSGHGFKHGPALGRYLEQLLSRKIQPEPRFSLDTKTAGRSRAVY